MFGGTIAKRVHEALNQRIKEAEDTYKTCCAHIDHERDNKIEDVRTEAEMKRKKEEDRLVEQIIGR